MTTAALTLSPRGNTWETFAITDTRWLVAAFAWSLALLAALAWMRWLFAGYPMMIGAALVAGVVTAQFLREEIPALPAATLVRYALVDAVFVAFSLHPLFALIQFAAAATGITSSIGGIVFGLLPPLVVVPGFYAGIAFVGHARRSPGHARLLPTVAAAILAVAFAPGAYRRYAEDAAQQRSRDARVATYEQSTGKRVSESDRLAIGNSLHGFDHRVNAIAIDREGRLLVAGGFNYYAGKDARGFVRLLPDGRLDESFAAKVAGDPVNSAPSFMLVASDGSIVADGGLSGSALQSAGIARLNPDGVLDERFRLTLEREPGRRESVEARDLQPGGAFVFAFPARFLGRPDEPCVQRISSDGTHDAAFESAALEALFGPAAAREKNLNCNVTAVTVLTSGKLLLQGAFAANAHRFGLLRLNPDGTLDAAYRAELGGLEASRLVVAPRGEVYALAQDPVPGALPPTYRLRCVKLDANGRADRSFDISANDLRLVDRLAVQPDGKLLVAGTSAAGVFGSIFRYLPDGSPDPSFHGARIDGFLTTLLVQTDGRIVVGGEFLEVGGAQKGTKRERFNIARLNADGSHDETFDPR